MANLMLAPSPWFTALDSNGAAISGAKIYTLAAGGTWPGDALATYTDAAGLVANTNPVVCDAAGRCAMFLLPSSYKLIYADAAGVTIRTQDNILAVSSFDANVDVSGIAGESIAARDAVYLADGTGSTTAGRWYRMDADYTYASNAAGLVGVAPAAIASGATGSIRLQGQSTGHVALTPGAAYYASTVAGALTSTPPTNRRYVGQADTSTTLVVQPTKTEILNVFGLTRTVMTGNVSLTTASTPYQFFDPDAARDITLPSPSTGLGYVISNFDASGYVLTVKTAGGSTVTTVINGQTVTVIYDGTDWQVIG